MAMNQSDIDFVTVALVASTAQSVAGVKAAANVALKILESAISHDGATSSNAPVVVNFARCTFATNSPGTNSTTFTPNKRDPGRGETIQATAATHWTTEPTVVTPQHSKDIGQFNGLYHYINPFSSPHIVAGGGGWVIRANSPNNVNCTGHITPEEG